jgi:hypothetical protein
MGDVEAPLPKPNDAAGDDCGAAGAEYAAGAAYGGGVASGVHAGAGEAIGAGEAGGGEAGGADLPFDTSGNDAEDWAKAETGHRAIAATATIP